MSNKDDQAAATKQDISMLMEQMGTLYDANERWKDEILDANEKWKDEIIHEFHLVAEDSKHDIGGVQNDRIAGVENRVTRLEQHTGMPV